MGFQRVGGDPGIVAPDLVQQYIASDHLIAGAAQIFQDRRFFFGQPDLAVAVFGIDQHFRRRAE